MGLWLFHSRLEIIHTNARLAVYWPFSPRSSVEFAQPTPTVHPIKEQHLHVPFGLGVESMSSKYAIFAIKLVHFDF